MARTDTLGNFLTDVANAIREKGGTTDTIQASEFDTKITNLPSGGGNKLILETTSSSVKLPNMSIEINEGTINPYQFYATGNYHNLKNVTINNIKTISSYSFYSQQRITSLTLGEGIEEIQTNAFWQCISMQINGFPNSLKKIRDYAFSSCNAITSLVFGENLTTLGMQTFATCSNLQEITFKRNTSVDRFCFSGCSSLSTIKCLTTTPPTITNNSFQNCPITRIEVPSGSLNTYKTASNWSAYADKMVEV